MNFLDVLSKNAKEYPSSIIYEDEIYGEYSYKYVDEMSSRISAFLESKNIGTEDVVAIKMKRSARIFIVMLAVWKSGAAFTVIGERSPKEYVEHVLKETKPKLIFDDNSFKESTAFSPNENYKIANLHDLACIIYSTGSSGLFKGSMHEYGKIQKAMKWYDNNQHLYSESDKSFFAGGFYSVSVIEALMMSVFYSMYYYVLPFEKQNNFDEIAKIIKQKGCTAICSSSEFIEYINNKKFPTLKVICSIYDTMKIGKKSDYIVCNSYGLTEAFGELTYFIIDKDYDIVPIGKPFEEFNFAVVDNDNNITKTGEIGELCFNNEYFRGYKNNEELTKSVFYDGMFHTGDMCYCDKNGNYVIVGRKIDIIKTDKGYVIPNIITMELKKRFPKTDSFFVKLFGNSKKYKVCLYYCSDKQYDLEDFKLSLKDCLPQYMMPTHCAKMEKFEYFPSGKINRLKFYEID